MSKPFDVEARPTWCPGCGDWSIWGALKQALVELKLGPHEVVIVYDIGCSGNMTNFVYAYGFHGLHGRALPVATGIKIANHNLHVFVIMGDGGCYGEGMNHFLQVIRGNHDITLIVHDNQIYGLTTGQKSPTSLKGHRTKSSPQGTIDLPVDPIALALVSGGSFVSRGFSADIPHLKELIKEATLHQGLGFIDILQPCVTFNKLNTYDYFRERIYKLEEAEHDRGNYKEALDRALEWPSGINSHGKEEKIPIGIFYQEEKPAYTEQLPQIKDKSLTEQDLKNIDITPLFDYFM